MRAQKLYRKIIIVDMNKSVAVCVRVRVYQSWHTVFNDILNIIQIEARENETSVRAPCRYSGSENTNRIDCL